MTVITRVHVTPVAFADPPLLNAVGLHEPYALRAIIEVGTSDGVTGLGETYADAGHLARVTQAAQDIVGLDVYALNAMRTRIATALGGTVGRDAHGLTGVATESSTVDRVFAPFEVACIDIQAKIAGVPVSALLGGAVRDTVPYSAYLFYKLAAHPGHNPDEWGEVLDADGIVAEAETMLGRYGFRAIKLKGGVRPPDEEIAAIEALHKAFPDHPLRLDPNAAWTVDTAIEVGRALEGKLEYLEDPTPGLAGMAKVAREVPMPLATNMCVVCFEHIAPSVAQGSVGIVLSDHHYWGGLQRSRLLSGICETFTLGLSMHSNSHLGISLAAMTHLAAATPNLSYACDTHWPWKADDEDVIVPGALRFVDGTVPVPATPGLGVELDRDALARLHQTYLDCGLTSRDDTGYMQRIDPSYTLEQPRW